MKITHVNQSVKLEKNGDIWVSDSHKNIEIIQRDPETLWIITPNKVYTIKCTQINKESKEVTLLVKGVKSTLKITEPIDDVLASMGLKDALTPKVLMVKAPMPGLVLDIKIAPGDSVKKGDTLIILEAMKMENAIKSPSDAVIENINVNIGQAVDKNHVLVNFAQ